MKTVAPAVKVFYQVLTAQVPLHRAKVKVQLLHAGDRRAILGCGAKGPGSESTDHAGFNAVTKGVQDGKVGDLAAGVDGDIDHHIPLYPMGED